MKVAVTNINLKLHVATQPFNLHVFITLYFITFTIKNNVVVHVQYYKHHVNITWRSYERLHCLPETLTPIERDVSIYLSHAVSHCTSLNLQSRNKHVSIESNCALQRVTGIAVLAVDLCLRNSTKPFSSLSSSLLVLHFSVLATSPLAVQCSGIYNAN